MKKTYDLIYSIGASCACAGYMKKHFLRTFSGPLDWLTNTTLETNTNFIINDFNDFLNIEDFEYIGKNPKPEQNCDEYKNTRTGLNFYHDFKSDIPFEESFRFVQEKYKRRISRFYEKIKSNERVLLIWFNYTGNTPAETIIEQCNAVMDKFGKKLDFLIIEHDETKTSGKIENKQLSENITHVLLYIQKNDENGSPTTYGDIKNCNRVFKNYQLKMSCFKRFYLHTKKYAIKILCAFVPSKELRRKLKKDL